MERNIIGNSACNLYDYLIALNYNDAGNRLDAIEAVELYLKKNTIPYAKTNKYSEIYNLILSNQPQYIDAGCQFIEKFILPDNKDIPTSELKKIIRANYKKYFRFQNTPSLDSESCLDYKGRKAFIFYRTVRTEK